jgi:hypothetical protein
MPGPTSLLHDKPGQSSDSLRFGEPQGASTSKEGAWSGASELCGMTAGNSRHEGFPALQHTNMFQSSLLDARKKKR